MDTPTKPKVTFFHAPQSRSGGTRALLEELGADYDLHALNFKTGEQRKSAYLAINPMGKVPAIRHGDALITEQPAVFMYLADLYPEAKLAPPIGDPLRGPYLRWLVFYGSCFEPALMKTLTDQLEKGPYLLGDTFSAADVLWGSALNWTTMFKLVPELPVIRAYIDRVITRPAMQRAAEKDAELVASQAA